MSAVQDLSEKQHARPGFNCSHAAVAALLLTLSACSGGVSSSEDALDIFAVARDDLRITVSEDAEIKAFKETRVKSRVEGQAQIIYLIEEGSIVKEGEKLVELDASALIERRAGQAISVAKARAALVQAQKNMEILEKELAADEGAAESKKTIAEMEMEKFLGRRTTARAGVESARRGDAGTNAEMLRKLRELIDNPLEAGESEEARLEGGSPGAAGMAKAGAVAGGIGDGEPQRSAEGAAFRIEQQVSRTVASLVGKVRELLDTGLPGEPEGAIHRDMGDMANQILQQIDQIRLARADLKIKEDTYRHSLRLREKEYITQNELDKHWLEFQSQTSRVTLAWNNLDLLINYGLSKEKIQLAQNVTNSELELDRVLATNEARRAREQANLESKEAEDRLAQERLDNLEKQITNATITAPNPGLVVYARVGDGRRGRGEVVEEGTSVRERQNLIILPDTSRMVANLKVQEADIDKIARGQKAVVHVDAFPGKTFLGEVNRVAPLPDSGSWWSNSDRKVYKTSVEIEGQNEDQLLRPNMSAKVEIVVAHVADTLPVPLQAIQRDRAVSYVWKLTRGGPVATPVRVGRSNLTHVEILEGVAEGDRVCLAPPSGVEQPSFKQPEVELVEPTEPARTEPTAGAPAPQHPASEQPASGQAFDMSEVRRVSEEMRAYLISKFPERENEIRDRRAFRTLMEDPEIQAALAANPQLRDRYEAMRRAMRERFGRRRGGDEGGGMRGMGDPGRRRGDGGRRSGGRGHDRGESDGG